ncbi:MULTISPECIES: GNAT family N-acetyltransferase [Thalassolituus]|jgi:GNAT superfamily N-acetyltransferase|uniref:GNAT family N-acetyltransferase n=1 Tax=Thalassolituus TaxID=187492 RepID=UPI0023F3D815|nr:GNAT family N-acetyltransferase [Thalassolituus oleivorans]
MRFILDTNILIQLEDSSLPLSDDFSSFSQLASLHNDQLLCHPASIEDIKRDKDLSRRTRILERLGKYQLLKVEYFADVDFSASKINDVCDRQILYALECDAAHYLVTQDQGIHRKAAKIGFSSRVITIQQANDLLSRLYRIQDLKLPDIENVSIFNLVPLLQTEFFSSLRDGYEGFDDWFRAKAKEGRSAWIYRDNNNPLAALCVYAIQEDEVITDDGLKLNGRSLKLCTFKVDETVRGKKVGELLLKMAFRYATDNQLENIFVHTDAHKQEFLISFLEDFGFKPKGIYQKDLVFVKEHPSLRPSIGEEMSPLEYLKSYFPHFIDDPFVEKYIVPIRSHYHKILFPDFNHVGEQINLFSPSSLGDSVGNPIKQAYLCHSNTKTIKDGSIVLFYRSQDLQAITTVGVVEEVKNLSSPEEIIRLVKRRTVYSYSEIEEMSRKVTKVLLFRVIYHLDFPKRLTWLKQNNFLKNAPISITRIDDEAYDAIIR